MVREIVRSLNLFCAGISFTMLFVMSDRNEPLGYALFAALMLLNIRSATSSNLRSELR